MAREQQRGKVRRRERKNISSGVAHVNASFNNTMISIVDAQGGVVCWSSAGRVGFKGAKKGTPYAAGVCALIKSKNPSWTPAQIREMTGDGTIAGGMIPKTETALAAIEGGVRAVVILDGRAPNACLLELYTDHGAGSLIRAPR